MIPAIDGVVVGPEEVDVVNQKVLGDGKPCLYNPNLKVLNNERERGAKKV